MAGTAVASMLCTMTSRAVTITLELRLAGDELDGRASDGFGPERPFSGWLGMLVTIDSLLSAADENPPAEAA
jgi:hypothetical protein